MKLSDLRVIPDNARYIFPFEAMVKAVSCPACRCMKSGDEDIPNRVQECCEDYRCACHAEEEAA